MGGPLKARRRSRSVIDFLWPQWEHARCLRLILYRWFFGLFDHFLPLVPLCSPPLWTLFWGIKSWFLASEAIFGRFFNYNPAQLGQTFRFLGITPYATPNSIFGHFRSFWVIWAHLSPKWPKMAKSGIIYGAVPRGCVGTPMICTFAPGAYMS